MDEFRIPEMEIGLTFMSALWTGILFIVLLTKLYKHRTEDSFGSKTIVIATLTNYFGWSVCFFVKSIIRADQYDIIVDANMSSTFTKILLIISVTVYSIAFVSSYIFVIQMLYQSFKGSEFQIRKCTLYLHTILTIILFISCFCATYFLNVNQYWLGGYLTFLNVLIYCIGLCGMVYTLNMKLIKMILMSNNKSKLNLFTPISVKFMATITKLSVLQAIFTVSAILYVITSIVHNVVFYNFITYLLDWIIYNICIMCGTLCMYLTFSTNNREYSCLCKSCDTLCKSCCNSTVKTLYGSEIMIAEMQNMRRSTMSVKTHSSKTRTDQSRCSTMTTNAELQLPTTELPDQTSEETVMDEPPTTYRQSTASITAISMGVDGKMDDNNLKKNLEGVHMEVIDESVMEMNNLDMDNIEIVEMDIEQQHVDGLMPLGPPSINPYDITPQVSLENNLA